MTDLSIVPTVNSESSAYRLMINNWTMIADILAGAEAIRAKNTAYLPKYEDESRAEYDRRVKTAPWRPEFADTLRSLSSKPFGKDVSLLGDVPEQIKVISEDIDSRGNSLTVFARKAFRDGIADGLNAILVDYPTMSPGLTLADEKAAGARPYWVHIPASSIIALYTDIINGREVPVHVRIRETDVIPNGFGERIVNRVRVFQLNAALQPEWQLWEEQYDQGLKANTYAQIGGGPISLGVIPLVLYFTGDRLGEHAVRPPLLDLAFMQIELYQALSRQDEVLTFAGSPMLAANGFALEPGASIAVGPKRVLMAPPGFDGGQTSWSFVQPNAANITEVRNHVTSLIDDMRRLGMQPMTPKSGTPTATGQSIEAAKAHSAVQAWALDLKDALEQAWAFTGKWIGETAKLEVRIDTDFSIEPYAPAPLQTLQAARNAKDISLHTYWHGLQRFDVLPSDFDPDDEEAALAEELQGLEPDVPIDPATGKELITPPGNAGANIGGKETSVQP